MFEELYLIEEYKEQLASLETQFQYIQAAIADHTKAKLTVDQLGKNNDNASLLFPIGGGTYIDATANQTSKILFDVGAGIVIEKTTDDAINKLNNQIESLQQTQQKISSMVQKLQTEADEISKKAQELMNTEQ